MTMRPDPTFHASPKLAMEAPPENFAYTLLLSPDFSNPDALAVIDVKPGSPTFSQIVHTVTMPYNGDEFHHFGWNACSSALSPLTGHAFLERRYLIIPGIRSSRIYVIDTKPDPTKAKIHKIIEPEEVFKKTGYSRPHTVHCGPEGIYVSTLGGGGKDGTDGPPGIFIMDCETFDILGRWEIDRGPQNLHYDFWWNLPRDYMVTSEWALPPQFETESFQRICSRISTAIGSTSGISGLDATCRRSTSAPIIRWRSKCGRRMIPSESTASSAWWSTPQTWKARSGPGGARATNSKSRRRRRFPRSQPQRSSCRRSYRGLALCRRWSPTLTSLWMIGSCMSPVGGPARCVSTMSLTRGSQSLPDPSTSAALLDARRTLAVSHMPAVHRWWRSAAMVAGCTGQTRSIRPGTINSIPTGYLAPRSWPMRARMAVSS